MLDPSNPTFLIAALVAIASGLIFAIRYVKPDASRDYDVIFAVMGLIYAICIGWEGWRLIPLLYFAQLLVIVLGGFFAVETFRLRLQLVEKSRQVQGRVRRQGFDRTYPSAYDRGQPMGTRADGARIRDTGSRTIENRSERRKPRTSTRPQLTDISGESRPGRGRCGLTPGARAK